MPDFVIRVKVDPRDAVAGASAATDALGKTSTRAAETGAQTDALALQFQRLRASIDPVVRAQTELVGGTATLMQAGSSESNARRMAPPI